MVVKMNKPNLPKVKSLRKEIIYVFMGVVTLITLVIVINLNHVSKVQGSSNGLITAQLGKNAWYSNQKILRSVFLVSHSHSSTVITIESTPAQLEESRMLVQLNSGTTLSDKNAAALAHLQSIMPQAKNVAVEDSSQSMRASINSNALIPQGGTSNDITNSALSIKPDTAAKSNSTVNPNPLALQLENPPSNLFLSMGTMLPAKLDRQLNSDIPGQAYAHITINVYDTRTHSQLLIPAGSQLVGNYDSNLTYGQERIAITWRRINFPNGQQLNLPAMGGADPDGSGFGDIVNNHYGRILAATLITSVLSAGAQLAQTQQGNSYQAPGVGQTIGQSVGTQIAQTGIQIVQKSINVQPTIMIRAGFDFQVEVNKDVVFSAAYTANSGNN